MTVRARSLRGAFPQHEIALQQELLRAFAGVDLGREDVAFRVHRQIVDPMELARIAAIASESAQDLTGGALHDSNLVIGAVGI